MGAQEKKAEVSLRSKLEEMGPSRAVQTWLRDFGNVRTKATYALELALYLRWLKQTKGLQMGPDDLVADNLKRIFESPPTDVSRRKITST